MNKIKETTIIKTINLERQSTVQTVQQNACLSVGSVGITVNHSAAFLWLFTYDDAIYNVKKLLLFSVS